MAHDLENEIRQKVWAAEASPLDWRKEQVWRQIQMPSARTVSPRVFYYGAAAALIAVMVIAYLFQLNVNQATELKIRSLELAVADQMKQQQSISTIPTKATEITIDSLEAPCLPERLAAQQRKKEMPIAETEIILETIPQIETTPLVTSEIVEIPLEITTASERLPVQAIVGIIPEKQITVAKSNKKKIRIRLRIAPDLGPDQPKAEENNLLTARIN